VANGYGRNYLLPRGLAIVATPGNERSLAQQQKARLAREAKSKADAEALATQLQALSLSIAKKTGEGERLYGSVTSMDIADLLKARGVSLDRRRIVLDTALKTLGTHKVPIRLHPEVVAEVTVAVTKEA
jgi:large subunit ribosomal protein L9